MKKNNAILLIGSCGSGKTWVMKNIIQKLSLNRTKKFKLLIYQTNDNVVVLGKYDGSMFEGSDKLSMAVAKDFSSFKKFNDYKNYTIIAEGDRFMNKTFIEVFNPYIIKITDTGEKGRIRRNSNQTLRQIKTIQTRVNNIQEHKCVKNSNEALSLILKLTK